jgi:hypothetical protein
MLVVGHEQRHVVRIEQVVEARLQVLLRPLVFVDLFFLLLLFALLDAGFLIRNGEICCDLCILFHTDMR